MIDKSHKAPGKRNGVRPSGSYFRRRKSLEDFTPVPRQTTRHDGWTEERQRGFIAALADTGSVRHAAHSVNMTPEGAYLLAAIPRARAFARRGKLRSAWAFSGSKMSPWIGPLTASTSRSTPMAS